MSLPDRRGPGERRQSPAEAGRGTGAGDVGSEEQRRPVREGVRERRAASEEGAVRDVPGHGGSRTQTGERDERHHEGGRQDNGHDREEEQRLDDIEGLHEHPEVHPDGPGTPQGKLEPTMRIFSVSLI